MKEYNNYKQQDYIGNELNIGDMIIFSSFAKTRTISLETGTIVGKSPQKLKVRLLGAADNSWKWVYPTASILLQYINKQKV